MEAIYFYPEKLPAPLNNWYRSQDALCKTVLAWKSAREGDFCTGSRRTLLFETAITIDAEQSRPAFSLYKWVFSSLYAEWDYNLDLVVLAEETRYIRDILHCILYLRYIESNSMHFQMAAVEMHKGGAPVTTAFTDIHF